MTTTQTQDGASVGSAIAQRDNTPAALVMEYTPYFATMLPSHVLPDRWVSAAVGVLRSNPKINQAAQNDVTTFMQQLRNAAQMGLMPGTPEYYLTIRKERGIEKVLGIPGYQGLIELIYRAGAVASVIAEVVYTGDRFEYVPGRDERPSHIIDWDLEDRGQLRLAYAYAVMKDGATSKVIVLNGHDINRIKRSSQGANSDYSPWKTNPAAMWLKSAVRQLAKWVPTSAEYRREQLRAAQEVYAETQAQRQAESRIPAPAAAAEGEHVDEVTGEVFANEPPDDEVHDAELVEDDPWGGDRS